jgi:hypothetical protein
MNVKFRKLGWLIWRWLGVFIASNHFLAVGYWWHTGQSGGAPDRVLFTVWCLPRQQTVGVWSYWLLKSFVLLLHRTVRWHIGHVRCVLTLSLTSDFCTVHCWSEIAIDRWRIWPLLCWLIGHAPVHTGQSGEWLPEKPDSGQFGKCSTWAPDSVRCTPDSVWCATGSTIANLCSKLGWVPNLISFLVYVEPYAPKINDN